MSEERLVKITVTNHHQEVEVLEDLGNDGTITFSKWQDLARWRGRKPKYGCFILELFKYIKNCGR